MEDFVESLQQLSAQAYSVGATMFQAAALQVLIDAGYENAARVLLTLKPAEIVQRDTKFKMSDFAELAEKFQ